MPFAATVPVSEAGATGARRASAHFANVAGLGGVTGETDGGLPAAAAGAVRGTSGVGVRAGWSAPESTGDNPESGAAPPAVCVRSAIASPSCKTGARRAAAHSGGWQEYGTYRRPTTRRTDVTHFSPE